MGLNRDDVFAHLGGGAGIQTEMRTHIYKNIPFLQKCLQRWNLVISRDGVGQPWWGNQDKINACPNLFEPQ